MSVYVFFNLLELVRALLFVLNSFGARHFLSYLTKRVFYILFQETLTGFKWMANKSIELMEKGKTVLFAFEEAIGN